MTFTAIVLVTISAFTHAFWNFLSKRQNPSTAFFLIASTVSAILLAPILIVYHQGLPYVTVTDWILIAATGICQATYYVGLAGAYRNGDLSLAYPLARALPVLLVAVISLVLGRGSQIGGSAFVGFFVVAIGCLVLPLPGFSEFRLIHYLNACCLFASLAALGTSGYTLIDDQVLRNLRTAPGISLTNTQVTLFFMALENISLTLALAVYVCLYIPDCRTLRNTWKAIWLPSAIAGLMMSGAYGLVLLAMAYVRNVSFISAFRQLSIPIGAVMGIVFRKESRPWPKLFGIVLILLGLVVVTLSKY